MLKDPAIKAYLQEAGVEPERVQTRSASEVIIWNHPGPWPRIRASR